MPVDKKTPPGQSQAAAAQNNGKKPPPKVVKPPKMPPGITDPVVTLDETSNIYRAFTENGCVRGQSLEEVVNKHVDRINKRNGKGWPVQGKGRN
jgi:hypothetical protein